MKAFTIWQLGILAILIITIGYDIKAQNFQFQGSIHNDTTWTADTLIITGNVLIDSNVTLSILPGTFIHIIGYFSIQSYGAIHAIGSISDSIIFTHLDSFDHADTSTTKGGWHGIRFLPRSSTDTSFFKYCRIENGKAIVPGSWIPYWDKPDNRGGNIYAVDFGSIVIENSYIGNGRSKAEGGGLFFEDGNYVLIENCHFKHNRCYIEGGGAAILKVNNLYIRQNLFNYNKVLDVGPDYITGGGAAIFIRYALGYDAYARIESNRVFNNYSPFSMIGDGYYNADVINNIICNNFGHGIYNAHYFNHRVYSNNIIVNNAGMGIGGITILSPHVKLYNNIIRENYMYPDNLLEQIYFTGDQNPQVNYCNVQLGYEGEGNVDLEPLFVDPTEGAGLDYDGLAADWSLLDSSPCVNTGTPDTTGLNLPATDLLGNPRIYGIRVDMGAIENQMVVGLPQNPLVNARVQVSPNPFGQSFKVVAPGRDKISSISLFNQNGQQIATETMMPFEQMLVFDLRNQSPGLYLLVTRFADGSTETTKLVKY